MLVSHHMFYLLLMFVCVLFRPLGCGGRLQWLYCLYLGGWGPETTLDLFSFVFQCLVSGVTALSGMSELKFCSMLFFQTLESWWDYSCCHHIRVSTICPTIHNHRLGTLGWAGAFRPTAHATHGLSSWHGGGFMITVDLCCQKSAGELLF